MQKLEKRSSPRQALKISLRFRALEPGSNDPELASETTDISRSGLFMQSPLRMLVGTSVSITLRVPTHLSGSARSDIHCTGRVVHERALPNGNLGYGIQFEQFLNLQQPDPPAKTPTQPS